MLRQELTDRALPPACVPAETRLMSPFGKKFKPPRAAQRRTNCLRLTGMDPSVVCAIQDQPGTSDRGRVVDGIVREGVKSVLDAAPENQQPCERERRQAHCLKTMADR